MREKHDILINTLVELIGKEGGARLYVHSYGYDCDGTPLYNLSWKPIIYSYYNGYEEIKECFKFNIFGGFSKEDFFIVHKKYVTDDIEFYKPIDRTPTGGPEDLFK